VCSSDLTSHESETDVPLMSSDEPHGGALVFAPLLHALAPGARQLLLGSLLRLRRTADGGLELLCCASLPRGCLLQLAASPPGRIDASSLFVGDSQPASLLAACALEEASPALRGCGVSVSAYELVLSPSEDERAAVHRTKLALQESLCCSGAHYLGPQPPATAAEWGAAAVLTSLAQCLFDPRAPLLRMPAQQLLAAQLALGAADAEVERAEGAAVYVSPEERRAGQERQAAAQATRDAAARLFRAALAAPPYRAKALAALVGLLGEVQEELGGAQPTGAAGAWAAAATAHRAAQAAIVSAWLGSARGVLMEMMRVQEEGAAKRPRPAEGAAQC
jgi:hypothetical protein